MGISHIVQLVQLTLSSAQGSCLQGPGDAECTRLLLWGSSWNRFQNRILEVGGENNRSLSMGNEGWETLPTCRYPGFHSGSLCGVTTGGGCPTDVYLYKIQ